MGFKNRKFLILIFFPLHFFFFFPFWEPDSQGLGHSKADTGEFRKEPQTPRERYRIRKRILLLLLLSHFSRVRLCTTP